MPGRLTPVPPKGVVVNTYRVLFQGLLEEPERFKENMRKIGVSADLSKTILQSAPVFLKAGMALQDALRYAEAVQKAGGKVRVLPEKGMEKAPRPSKTLPIKPLEYFTMCPTCGHKQPKSERCVRCGCALP
jgi:hypothetical protein